MQTTSDEVVDGALELECRPCLHLLVRKSSPGNEGEQNAPRVQTVS